MDSEPLSAGVTADTTQPTSDQKHLSVRVIQNAGRNRSAKENVKERRQTTTDRRKRREEEQLERDELEADDSAIGCARRRLAAYSRDGITNESIRHSRRTELLMKGKKNPDYVEAKQNFQAELKAGTKIANELEQQHRAQQSSKSQHRRELRNQLEEMRIRLANLQQAEEDASGSPTRTEGEDGEGKESNDPGTPPPQRSVGHAAKKKEPFKAAADKAYLHLVNDVGLSDVRRVERKRKPPQNVQRRAVGHRHRGARGGFADREDYQRGDAPLLTMLQSTLAQGEFDGPRVQPRVREEVLARVTNRSALNMSSIHHETHNASFLGDSNVSEEVYDEGGEQFNRTFETMLNEVGSRVCGDPSANTRFFPSPNKTYVEPLRRGGGASSVPLYETGRVARKEVPDVCRSTQSLRAKKKILTMTFFDEHGAINGEKERIDALPPLRPGHGFVSPSKRQEAVKKANEEENVKIKEYQRSSGQLRTVGSSKGKNSSLPSVGGEKSPTAGPAGAGSAGGGKGGAGSGLTSTYQGPKHDTHRKSAPLGKLDERRIKELTTGVFVQGGNVSSYLHKMERECRNGNLVADNRRSVQDRLGGTSKPRPL